MSVVLHHGDLPAGLSFGSSVAIDTETMGLIPQRDRLCVALRLEVFLDLRVFLIRFNLVDVERDACVHVARLSAHGSKRHPGC